MASSLDIIAVATGKTTSSSEINDGAPADDGIAGTQLAQAASSPLASAIGEIAAVDGSVTIIRADGTSETAEAGDPLYIDDHVETGAGAAASVLFIDGARVSIDAETSLVIDTVVYAPEGDGNSMLLSVMKGAFEFIAGAIAPAAGDGMAIQTSAGTLSVRGTSGVGVQDPATGNWHFSLIRDADGHLGRILILNPAGQVLLDEEFETTRILNAVLSPDEPRVLSEDEMRAIYSEVLRSLPQLDQELQDDGVEGENPQGDGAPDEEASAIDQQTFDSAVIQQQIVAAAQSLGFIVAGNNTIADTMDAPPMLPIGDRAIFIADNNGASLAGLFDDIFEGPLIPMPVRAPSYSPPPALVYNHIYGTNGGETLHGTSGADHIHGLGGDDVLVGGAGNDILDGGAGNDTFNHWSDSPATHGVHVNLAAGKVFDDGNGGVDTLISIENVVGTDYADILDVRGAGANEVYNNSNSGVSGNDIVYSDATDSIWIQGGNNRVYSPTPTSGTIIGTSGVNDCWYLIDSDGDLVDLSQMGAWGRQVQAIEKIDLSASNNSGITVTLADILFNVDADTLTIFGDADNTVTSTSQGWVGGGTTVVDGQTMDIYTSGGATLMVDTDILATIS